MIPHIYNRLMACRLSIIEITNHLMEKRIFGILLTVLGLAGLIYAGFSIIETSGSVKTVAVYGVLGLIFFLAGIGLLRNTQDKAT